MCQNLCTISCSENDQLLAMTALSIFLNLELSYFRYLLARERQLLNFICFLHFEAVSLIDERNIHL